MKNIIQKTGIVLGIFLLTTQLTSCKKTKSGNIAMTTKNEVTVKNNVKEKKAVTYQKPVVFLTGYDKNDESFYTNARNYFFDKKYQIVNEAYSLEEIITWLNRNSTNGFYKEIHIVSKGNPWKKLDLETVINGEKISEESIRKNLTQGRFPKLKDVVTSDTKIVFHANALENKTQLINSLKEVFVAKEVPTIVTSPYYSVFGGEFTNHYLAKPYYVFYPTANSPGKVDLSKEIAKKYPEEKEIDWFEALNNETERYVGEPYTIQFSIPIKWEFDYHNSDDEIPTFTSQEEIMDWIEQNEDLNREITKMEIPLEKFRWRWSVKNSKLTIKGKTSVLCVLKPLLKPYGDLEYIEPDTNNKRLFAMK